MERIIYSNIYFLTHSEYYARIDFHEYDRPEIKITGNFGEKKINENFLKISTKIRIHSIPFPKIYNFNLQFRKLIHQLFLLRIDI